jgi:hypothetical protein
MMTCNVIWKTVVSVEELSYVMYFKSDPLNLVVLSEVHTVDIMYFIEIYRI